MIIDDYSAIDTGGKVIFLSTLSLKLIEVASNIQFSDIFTGLMGLAGFVYMVVKIQGGILDNRVKRKKLKEGEKEQ